MLAQNTAVESFIRNDIDIRICHTCDSTRYIDIRLDVVVIKKLKKKELTTYCIVNNTFNNLSVALHWTYSEL
jgi:hypothetical protein